MKRFATAAMFVMCIVLICAAFQQVGEQNLLRLSFVSKGVSAQGNNVLQTGEVNNLSAAVATATLTQIVAAPTSGSIYVREVLVEKSTGSAGSYTLQYGTGTNCATGTTVLLGPVTNPAVMPHYLGILVPAAKALCVQTDASTTSVRVLYN